MIELVIAAALSIQGPWFKPCEQTEDHTSIHEELKIYADQWIRTTHSNTKPGCRGEDFLTLRRVYKATANEPDLDLQTVALTYTPRTSETAAVLNATRFCGLNNWEAQVENSVLGLQCGEKQMPERGEITYSTFRLQPREPRDLLWIGEATPNATGTSKENRHLIFELFAFERADYERADEGI